MRTGRRITLKSSIADLLPLLRILAQTTANPRLSLEPSGIEHLSNQFVQHTVIYTFIISSQSHFIPHWTWRQIKERLNLAPIPGQHDRATDTLGFEGLVSKEMPRLSSPSKQASKMLSLSS